MMSVDCILWQKLQQGLGYASSHKAFETVDQIERALNTLAIKIIADPRRVAAVHQDCGKLLGDIQARAQAAGTPRQIPDPSHSPALIESWLPSLPDDVLVDVETAVKAAKASRK